LVGAADTPSALIFVSPLPRGKAILDQRSTICQHEEIHGSKFARQVTGPQRCHGELGWRRLSTDKAPEIVMFFWLGIAVAIVLLAVVAIAVAFYLPYRLSPEMKWRVRVEQRMADAEKRVGAERRKLQEAALILKREERALRRRALDTFLQSLSAAELEAYPGIGPGTVSKLRSAGFTNLAMLQNVRIRVRGCQASCGHQERCWR
jgi:hypothetical protein